MKISGVRQCVCMYGLRWCAGWGGVEHGSIGERERRDRKMTPVCDTCVVLNGRIRKGLSVRPEIERRRLQGNVRGSGLQLCCVARAAGGDDGISTSMLKSLSFCIVL